MSTQTQCVAHDLFAGGGSVGDMLRAFDWASSSSGLVRTWAPCLRTAVRLCLTSRFPTVIFCGPEFRVLYNDAYVPLLAGKHPTSLGEAAGQVFPEIWATIGPTLERVFTTGEAAWSEDLLLPLTHCGVAEARHFTFSYSPIQDETGHVYGVFCPVMETTERKNRERRAQAMRHEAEATRAHQHATLESITDGFFTVDRDWRFTYVNPRAKELWRDSHPDVLGKRLWDEFPGAETLVFGEQLHKAMRERVTVAFEGFYPPWKVWVEVRAYPSSEGLAVYFHDITARKQSDDTAHRLHSELEHRVKDRTRALQASEERFRIVAQVTNDLLYDWNMSTNIIWWSPGMQHSFGTPVAGPWQWGVSRLHPDDRERVSRQLHEAVRSQADTFHCEYRLQRLDGTYAVVLDTMYLARNALGEAVRGIGAITDITVRKEAEAARDAAILQLINVQERERRHLARELHDEVMQTLTALQINLDLLGQGQVAATSTLHASMALVEDLVDQVRALSLELRPTVLDELGLAAALEWYSQRQVPRLGLAAHYSCPSTLPRPHPTIETTCFRVVQEAVTNVAKHADTDTVWIDLREEHDQLHITIRDCGKGFDVETTRRRAGHEIGIGLRGITERVQLVGGQCEIDSTPGHGTTIHVRTPRTVPGLTNLTVRV